MIRLAIIFILLSTPSQAFYVQGANQTCLTYLTYKNDQSVIGRAFNLANRSYIAGWISAKNFKENNNTERDFQEILSNVTDFCMKNPSSHLAQAMVSYE